MSSDHEPERHFDYFALGYDLRLTGQHADAIRLQRRLHWRPHLIQASYDTNVSPSMFTPPGETAEPYQTEIDPNQISDPYFATFRLFRSFHEAVSFMPDRKMARDFQLWYFSLILPRIPPSGILAGMLKAMQGEVVLRPDASIERLGYEILDSDGASVTHTYYDLSDTPKIDLGHLGETADRLAVKSKWLLAIDRITHPWWLPE